MSFDRFAHEAQALSLPEDVKAALEYHRMVAWGMRERANQVRDQWKERALQRSLSIPSDFATLWQDVAQPRLDLDLLPVGSWAIQFRFRLRTPYLSRDEELFHVIDNPVRAEPLWGLPFIASTSWKGLLRAAVRRDGGLADNDPCVRRLFGNPRATEQDFLQGRLRFFPTFFDKKGLEIINPHDRERRVGKNPIFIERVPAGAEGTFTLLYLPFGAPKADPGIATCCDDLCKIAATIRTLFVETGFSAKTSSGYGLAEVRLRDGTHAMRLKVGYRNIKVAASSSLNEFGDAAARLREQVTTEPKEVPNDP